MALLRVRITSFLSGFGLCESRWAAKSCRWHRAESTSMSPALKNTFITIAGAAFALYQLRQDVVASNTAVLTQVCVCLGSDSVCIRLNEVVGHT